MISLLNTITGSNRIVKAFLITFPFIVVTLYFIFIYKSPYYLLDGSLTNTFQDIPLTCYSDKIHNGNSDVAIVKNSASQLQYQYELRKGHQYQFVNVSYDTDDKDYLDLSGFDYARISIKSKAGERISFGLWMYEKDHTIIGNGLTYRPSAFVLNVEDQFKDIIVPFQEMYTPDWWYTENSKKESDFGEPVFSCVKSVKFSNCINIPLGRQDVVDVNHISFHVDYIPFVVYSFVFLAVYFAAVIIVRLLVRKNKEETDVNFIYGNTEVNSYSSVEEKKLFAYLITNYYQSSLSIADVQSNTGFSERQISMMIRRKSGLNFKQFINKLRMAEARRLLVESDLQISEIGFKLGYQNASAFGRVFKSMEGVTPNDFRKNKKMSVASISD